MIRPRHPKVFHASISKAQFGIAFWSTFAIKTAFGHRLMTNLVLLYFYKNQLFRII